MILFFQLPSIAKALSPVEAPSVFANRISKERELLTSHGEAGRLFVSFVHNGDQHERFHHPNSHPYQITLGIALLFTLQGIPSLYYGIRIRSYRDDRCRRQNRISPRMSQRVKRFGIRTRRRSTHASWPIARSRGPAFAHVESR